MGRSARCWTLAVVMASRAAAQSPGPPDRHAEMCGERPIITTSRTVNENAGASSWGTTAARRAAVRAATA